MEPPSGFFDPDELAKRPANLWRYLETLPFAKMPGISMGEGMTPLVNIDPSIPGVLAKLEYVMPTTSFKDRGAVVLVAKAAEQNRQAVIADSSGNAGTSIAAYCSRAGIGCDVYVRANISPKKLTQMWRHGARVVEVSGTREDAARAAIEAVESSGTFYASHVYNPLFLEGMKTFAFEMWEQLGWRAPERLVLPVGNGTMLLGAYIGFSELLAAGLIDELPQIIAVQAELCAPIAQAFADDAANVEPVDNAGTAAEGIAIAAPARGNEVLAAIRATGGSTVTVSESAIERARNLLAEKGFYVEPTAAVPYAGHLTLLGDKALTVLPLCGSGLKVA